MFAALEKSNAVHSDSVPISVNHRSLQSIGRMLSVVIPSVECSESMESIDYDGDREIERLMKEMTPYLNRQCRGHWD